MSERKLFPTGEVYCTQCGVIISPHDEYCTHCGAKQHALEKPASAPDNKWFTQAGSLDDSLDSNYTPTKPAPVAKAPDESPIVASAGATFIKPVKGLKVAPSILPHCEPEPMEPIHHDSAPVAPPNPVHREPEPVESIKHDPMPVIPVVPVKEEPRCKKCGAVVPKGTTLCWKCSTAESIADKTVAKKKKPNIGTSIVSFIAKSKKLILVGAVACVALVASVLLATGGLLKESEKVGVLPEPTTAHTTEPSQTKPTQAATTATKPVKDAEVDTKAVYAAYGTLLRDGVWLSCDNGDLEAATHYQLLEMNGDGIPEIIVFAVKESQHIPLFEIYSYSQNQIVKIADSLNTCDLSQWYNAGHSICIQNGSVVYEAGKSSGGNAAGTAGRLEYNGKKVKNVKLELGEHMHNAVGETPCEILVQSSDILGGISIGSPADFLAAADQKEYNYIDTWVCTIDYDGFLSNEINLNRDGTVTILDYNGTYEESYHVWNSAEGTWKLVKEKGNTYWIELRLSHHDTSNMGDPDQSTEYTEYTAVVVMQIDGNRATIQPDSGDFPYIFYDYSFERK